MTDWADLLEYLANDNATLKYAAIALGIPPWRLSERNPVGERALRMYVACDRFLQRLQSRCEEAHGADSGPG